MVPISWYHVILSIPVVKLCYYIIYYLSVRSPGLPHLY